MTKSWSLNLLITFWKTKYHFINSTPKILTGQEKTQPQVLHFTSNDFILSITTRLSRFYLTFLFNEYALFFFLFFKASQVLYGLIMKH